MIELKELINDNDVIRIIVEDEEFRDFLNWLKENDCLWKSGKIIQPEIDKRSETSKQYAITKDLLVYVPHGVCTLMYLTSKPKYVFKELNNDKLDITLSHKRIKKDNHNKTVTEKSHNQRLERNREISRFQFVNKGKYKKLESIEKQFLVNYKNDDELLRLFYLLESYGYENYYDVKPGNIGDRTKAICVDNIGKCFFPIYNLNCCCDSSMFGKIYDYIEFKRTKFY